MGDPNLLTSGIVGNAFGSQMASSIAGIAGSNATNWGLSEIFSGGGTGDGVGGNIGAPGFGESLIPIWGSGRAAINDFQQGRYVWGTVNTLIAATDVFLAKSIVTAVFKISARSALTISVKVAPKTTTLNPAFQRGFSSHRELVKHLGPAGKGKAWHHIVEQTPANIKKFGAEKIHNVNTLLSG